MRRLSISLLQTPGEHRERNTTKWGDGQPHTSATQDLEAAMCRAGGTITFLGVSQLRATWAAESRGGVSLRRPGVSPLVLPAGQPLPSPGALSSDRAKPRKRVPREGVRKRAPGGGGSSPNRGTRRRESREGTLGVESAPRGVPLALGPSPPAHVPRRMKAPGITKRKQGDCPTSLDCAARSGRGDERDDAGGRTVL